MEIRKEDALRLIVDLWTDNYHLTRLYFGEYLSQLLKALLEGVSFDEHFVKCAFYPTALEKRLNKIEHLGQTRSIVAEVGNIANPDDLDKRLSNAWAEIRMIDQLIREGFTNIQKVKKISDFTAALEDQNYAIQVIRINKSLKSEVNKKSTKSNISPFGSVPSIHDRLDPVVSNLFWAALEKKNGKFRNWEKDGYKRCIAIVSSDEDLQDPMTRHIACQQIRNGIHSLPKRHFEELVWLPDLGNGAWFKIGSKPEDTVCLADWKDELERYLESEDTVSRREVDLDSVIDAWKKKAEQ